MDSEVASFMTHLGDDPENANSIRLNMSTAYTYPWQPTRHAALQQLQIFLPQAGRDYARSRNSDYGVERRDNVSALSPWLRHRCISEAEVVQSVLERHTISVADKFVQEVFWRSYWKGWLEMRPQVWTVYRQEVDEMYQQEALLKSVEKATAGNTGIECFDSWCKELITTGYLHNHARMWFASIWIFTLRLPWQLGADFFLQHLLDGDSASNTLSWRWVAGLHTKGKYYLARADNIAKYTDGRFNPSQQLALEAHALTESHEFARQSLPAYGGDLPEGRTGLLMVDDDTHPEPLVSNEFVSAIAFSASDSSSPRGTSSLVTRFRHAVLQDALFLLSESSTSMECTSEQPICTSVEQIVAWAVAANLTSVVTAVIPVGPNRDALESLQGRLQNHGIILITIRRAWDNTVWPHAGKGFFALKKKIPVLIQELLPERRPELDRQPSLF